MMTLPTDSEERKNVPLYSGCIAYFPAALAGVARHSKAGNDKHNPGQPLHHARGKSGDELDCVARHLLDLGDMLGRLERRGLNLTEIEETLAEANALCWRTLSFSQKLHERWGAPLAPGARLPEQAPTLAFTNDTATGRFPNAEALAEALAAKHDDSLDAAKYALPLPQVGEVWRDGAGILWDVADVTDAVRSYPVVCYAAGNISERRRFTREGRFDKNEAGHRLNLVELVSAAPTAASAVPHDSQPPSGAALLPGLPPESSQR